MVLLYLSFLGFKLLTSEREASLCIINSFHFPVCMCLRARPQYSYVAMNEPFDPHRKVLEAGDFFGQMALLSEETVGYTVTAGPEAVDVLTLSRHDVTALLGPLHRLIIQREELEPQPNEVWAIVE